MARYTHINGTIIAVCKAGGGQHERKEEAHHDNMYFRPSFCGRSTSHAGSIFRAPSGGFFATYRGGTQDARRAYKASGNRIQDGGAAVQLAPHSIVRMHGSRIDLTQCVDLHARRPLSKVLTYCFPRWKARHNIFRSKASPQFIRIISHPQIILILSPTTSHIVIMTEYHWDSYAAIR